MGRGRFRCPFMTQLRNLGNLIAAAVERRREVLEVKGKRRFEMGDWWKLRLFTSWLSSLSAVSAVCPALLLFVTSTGRGCLARMSCAVLSSPGYCRLETIHCSSVSLWHCAVACSLVRKENLQDNLSDVKIAKQFVTSLFVILNYCNC